MNDFSNKRIVVAIPCLNEEITIGKVVRDFRTALPTASIIVFDNCSTDKTAEVARAAGAEVVYSPIPGKGNAIRHIFERIHADVVVMADGDDTYDATVAPLLVHEVLANGVDMAVGTRLDHFDKGSFRMFHKFGNRLISGLIAALFHNAVTDVLSGYRAFSSRFLRSVPLSSGGFEIETELTLQAATKGFTQKEVPTQYGTRPEGSVSKLNTYSDGFIILKSILLIFKDYKPLTFFTLLSLFLALVSLFIGSAPIIDFWQTGYVSHVPRAVLAAAVAILSGLFLGIGLVLDTVTKYHREIFHIWTRETSKNGLLADKH